MISLGDLESWGSGGRWGGRGWRGEKLGLTGRNRPRRCPHFGCPADGVAGVQPAGPAPPPAPCGGTPGGPPSFVGIDPSHPAARPRNQDDGSDRSSSTFHRASLALPIPAKLEALMETPNASRDPSRNPSPFHPRSRDFRDDRSLSPGPTLSGRLSVRVWPSRLAPRADHRGLSE